MKRPTHVQLGELATSEDWEQEDDDYARAMERYADHVEAYMDHIEAENKRLLNAFGVYGVHESGCILSQWHQGRPTADGGYETQFGSKWYQRGEWPECTCGFTAALKARES